MAKGDVVLHNHESPYPGYVTLKEYFEMMRAMDDRRYAEVNVEKEKALKIKETADLAALQLAREIQTYKDEKANQLREQIGSERNLYVTKSELVSFGKEVAANVAPLIASQNNTMGQRIGTEITYGRLVSLAVILGTVLGLVSYFIK